jgi:hypothetical protein
LSDVLVLSTCCKSIGALTVTKFDSKTCSAVYKLIIKELIGEYDEDKAGPFLIIASAGYQVTADELAKKIFRIFRKGDAEVKIACMLVLNYLLLTDGGNNPSRVPNLYTDFNPYR